ncbi:hypothetical protein Rsub_07469 [Raphidocelis subcapitata]|uniref:Uncharacterized protein n=1 Tax=Raphidocelis subcapitata TaxID=307507 RepID=A0A2V0P530_9CHLO|nr:hypothetical protein Rsub_07469 [Raphidocelis subcapitata]|eukprot:GBF94968.1 hypothetical protein Rsub_07469 [Raphidocelis subcapitata]
MKSRSLHPSARSPHVPAGAARPAAGLRQRVAPGANTAAAAAAAAPPRRRPCRAAAIPPPRAEAVADEPLWRRAAGGFAAAAAAAALLAAPPAAPAAEPLSPPLAPRPGPPPAAAPPLPAPADGRAPAPLAPLAAAPPVARPFVFREPLALTADSGLLSSVGMDRMDSSRQGRPGQGWLVKLLEVAALNVAGFWGVRQLVRASLDTSSPVTLVKVRLALKETSHGAGLRRRLGEMRQLGASGGPEELWLLMEETVNEVTNLQGSIALAEASAEYFKSQSAAFDAFKRVAASEAARADAEEEQSVQGGAPASCDRPAASPLQSLFGGAPVEDRCQEMVVVTLVVAARGSLEVPAVTNWPSLRASLTSVSGLSRSSLMALELLWAPDDAKDFLSLADVRQDFPDMVDLSTGRRVGDARAEAAQAPAGARGE